MEIILFFFPERPEKVFLEQPLCFIIEGVRVGGKEYRFAFAFVSHPVEGDAFDLGRI